METETREVITTVARALELLAHPKTELMIRWDGEYEIHAVLSCSPGGALPIHNETVRVLIAQGHLVRDHMIDVPANHYFNLPAFCCSVWRLKHGS